MRKTATSEMESENQRYLLEKCKGNKARTLHSIAASVQALSHCPNRDYNLERRAVRNREDLDRRRRGDVLRLARDEVAAGDGLNSHGGEKERGGGEGDEGEGDGEVGGFLRGEREGGMSVLTTRRTGTRKGRKQGDGLTCAENSPLAFPLTTHSLASATTWYASRIGFSSSRSRLRLHWKLHRMDIVAGTGWPTSTRVTAGSMRTRLRTCGIVGG